jgi:protein-disulfide isomerase
MEITMAALKIPVSSRDHIAGDENARITLVEYGDYQCPHCARAHPIVKRLQKHFGKDLRFVFRNFPLNEIHPFAESAAETAEFAAQFDRFWEMHDAIFENQENLGPELLLQLTQSLGLSESQLRQALAIHQYTEGVRQDLIGGARSGVNGTPSFFISGHRHDGSFEFDELSSAIQEKL